jgi:hypothetical protein
MQNLHNIEKSGFHHGQYVGYSGGRVFRITKSNSSFGNWAARQQNDVPGYPAQQQPTLYAFTLAAMSAQLEKLPTLISAALRPASPWSMRRKSPAF